MEDNSVVMIGKQEWLMQTIWAQILEIWCLNIYYNILFGMYLIRNQMIGSFLMITIQFSSLKLYVLIYKFQRK